MNINTKKLAKAICGGIREAILYGNIPIYRSFLKRQMRKQEEAARKKLTGVDLSINKSDFSAAQLIACAGSPISKDIQKKIKALKKKGVTVHINLTEGSIL